jgi:glycosyltransferase involved in cell wall biosynthesis
MKYLEENYISAVTVVRDDGKIVTEKVTALYRLLEDNFKHFEVIVVDNFSADDTGRQLKNLPLPVTVITLARLHGAQAALTAGSEIAIGDYIVEIADLRVDYDVAMVMELYRTCQRGNDFVFLTPRKIRNTSKLFYSLLNSSFKGSISEQISSSVITLSSRRGQNKTADAGKHLINRNLSYVLTGLKCASLPCDINYRNRRRFSENFAFMVDTLIHYTGYITTAITNIALLFSLITLVGVIYAIVMRFVMNTAGGWASTFVLCAAAFSVIFLILSVICKYLSHVLNMGLPKNYTFYSLEKKEKRS